MATIHISRNKLKAAAYFSGVKDIRYYLNGILIESTPMQTRIVATDGHALFCAKDDAKGDNVDTFTGIVPNDTIKQILAWKAPYKSAADLPVVITTAADEQRAEWCGNTAVFKLLDGKFPEYARVVPTAEALGTNKFGHFAFKQGGEGSAIAVFSTESFAVVMPMRGEKADVADVAWAREALPA